MEKIIEAFNKMNIKAKNVEEALKVLPHKVKVRSEFGELSLKNKEIQELKKMVNNSIADYNSILKAEYKKTTAQMNRVQMKMMLLLQHMDSMEKPSVEQEKSSNQVLSKFENNNKENMPSRMTLAEYSHSPLVKQKTRAQLQFIDFEAEVTEEAFGKIPSYMKLRASLSELQHFLDSVVIKTFNDKYQLLMKSRTALKKGELDVQIRYKEQAALFEGEKFVTDSDLAKTLVKNLDKKFDRYLQMLRHVQILREARKSSVVAYIWLNKF